MEVPNGNVDWIKTLLEGSRAIARYFGSSRFAQVELIQPRSGDIVGQHLWIELKCRNIDKNTGATIWCSLIDNLARFYIIGEASIVAQNHYILFTNISNNWQEEMGLFLRLLAVIVPEAISNRWHKEVLQLSNSTGWMFIHNPPPGLIFSKPVTIRVTDLSATKTALPQYI